MKEFIRRNIKLLIILAFIIVIGSVGITLALRYVFGTTTNVSGTTGNVVVNISYAKDGNNNDITQVTSSGDLFPITIDTSNVSNVNNSNDVIKFSFGVSGVSGNPANSIYDVSLSNIQMDCALQSEYTKWVLYKNNTRLSYGNFSNTFDIKSNNRMVLTPTHQDLTTTEDSYLLVIYLEEDNINDQSSLLGKTFSANISVDTVVSSTKKNLVRTTGTDSSCNTTVNKLECADNLEYTGSTLDLIKGTIPTGVTVNQSTATTPGDYTITAKLDDGYAWSDGTTENYVFNCSIAKRSVTIASTNQYVTMSTSNTNYISSTGLIAGHTVHSIKLSSIQTTGVYDVIIPSMAVIYDSGNNDVTNYYNIN